MNCVWGSLFRDENWCLWEYLIGLSSGIYEPGFKGPLVWRTASTGPHCYRYDRLPGSDPATLGSIEPHVTRHHSMRLRDPPRSRRRLRSRSPSNQLYFSLEAFGLQLVMMGSSVRFFFSNEDSYQAYTETWPPSHHSTYSSSLLSLVHVRSYLINIFRTGIICGSSRSPFDIIKL